MAPDDDPSLDSPPMSARQVRDMVAVLLLVAGLVVLCVVAFRVDPLAGWAAVGLVLVGSGVAVGVER